MIGIEGVFSTLFILMVNFVQGYISSSNNYFANKKWFLCSSVFQIGIESTLLYSIVEYLLNNRDIRNSKRTSYRSVTEATSWDRSFTMVTIKFIVRYDDI